MYLYFKSNNIITGGKMGYTGFINEMKIVNEEIDLNKKSTGDKRIMPGPVL